MGQEHDDWLAGFGFDVRKYSSVVNDVIQAKANVDSSQTARAVADATGVAADLASAVGADDTARELRDVQATGNAEANLGLRVAEMQIGDAAGQLGVVLPGQENLPINVAHRAEEAGAAVPSLPPPDQETIHGTGDSGEEGQDE